MTSKELPTTVTDKNISAVVGYDQWIDLQEKAWSLRNAGDGSHLITQTEVDIFVGRGIISEVDNQLHLLNTRFPDERFKQTTEQNPCFRDKRSLLLALKEELVPEQKRFRSTVSRYHQQKLRERTPKRLYI